MKKKIVFFVMFFLAIILQTSVLPVIFRTDVVGDVVLMLILVGAIIDGFFAFFWWAVFAGVIYDLVIYSTVGVHSLTYLLVVYFVSFFSRRFSVELRGIGLALFLSFVVAATLLSAIIMALMAVFDSSAPQDFFKLLGSPVNIGVQVIYNMLLFFLCFVTFKKVKKFFAID